MIRRKWRVTEDDLTGGWMTDVVKIWEEDDVNYPDKECLSAALARIVGDRPDHMTVAEYDDGDSFRAVYKDGWVICKSYDGGWIGCLIETNPANALREEDPVEEEQEPGKRVPERVLAVLRDTMLTDVHDENGPGHVECPMCSARASMKWHNGRRLDGYGEGIEHLPNCPLQWITDNE